MKNINFRDKFPPEAAGKRKRHIFHDGFPPEGAHLLKASVCRDEFHPVPRLPEEINQWAPPRVSFLELLFLKWQGGDVPQPPPIKK